MLQFVNRTLQVGGRSKSDTSPYPGLQVRAYPVQLCFDIQTFVLISIVEDYVETIFAKLFCTTDTVSSASDKGP